MIVILDYGIGNVGSILNMIRRVGGEAIIASDEAAINSASAIVLPGVGSFDNGMEKLNTCGILACLNERIIKDKIPFLGICLGMQLLFEKSEEGYSKGLGLIPGEVKRFDFSNIEHRNLKLPQMGWNSVRPTNYNNLFKGMEDGSRFYFVHSFHAVCYDKKNEIGVTEYGYNFASAVKKDNIFGVQFHPEKSHHFGMILFKNFLALTKC